MKPYKDKQLTETSKIRVFKSDVDSGELQWHRDREDRVVESIGETDWMIQIDNELPKVIDKVFIPMGVWHRVIKGTGELKVKITKL